MLGRRNSLGLAATAALGALSNFGLILTATRTLPSGSQQSEFLAFWSVLTGMFGVCTGIQNESARAASAVRGGRPPQARLITAALPLGLVLAGAVLLAGPILTRYVLPLSGTRAVVALSIGTLAYAGYATLVGAAAGRAWWAGYTGILAGEVGARLVLALGVAAIGATLLRLETISVAALGVGVIALIFLAPARRALMAASDAGRQKTMSRMGLAIVSTAASAVLVTGYTALVKASSHGESASLVAAMMVAISITRAPIMMPLTTFQGVAISLFAQHRDRPLRALFRLFAWLAGLGVASAIAFAVLGPWLLRVFNPAYHIDWQILALLALTSAVMGALVLTGSLVLALDQHRWYVVGWVIAAVVSVALIFAPLSLAPRVLASLAVGPMIGTGILVWRLAISSRHAA